EPPALYCCCLRWPSVLGGVRLVLPRGRGSWPTARTTAWQYRVGGAGSGRLLQRLVVVAAGSLDRSGVDFRLAGADQYGSRRVGEPARSPHGITVAGHCCMAVPIRVARCGSWD